MVFLKAGGGADCVGAYNGIEWRDDKLVFYIVEAIPAGDRSGCADGPLRRW